MPLLNDTTARTYAIHDVQFTAHANSTTGAQQLAGWVADFAPRTPGQAHSMSAEELLHVLAGRLDVSIDDEQLHAVAGDTVLIPRGAAFRVSNLSDQPARAWVVTTLGMTATMAADGSELSPPWAQ